MPDRPIRKSVRLPGRDYASPGAYFVTVCTHARACIFGSVDEDRVVPSPAGKIVRAVWQEIPHHFLGIELDAFVIMPNHVHGVLILHGRGTACRAPTQVRNPRRS